MTKTFRLPNGLTCVVEERPQTGKVAMQVHVKLGAGSEAADEHGLTGLMQEASLGGTQTRSRANIADAVEAKGGAIGAGATRHASVFKASALARNAKETFEVLSDVVRNPAFAAEEVEKAKDQILQSLLQDEEEPRKQALNRLFSSAFQGQSLGRATDGTAQSVSGFTSAQLHARHAQLLAHPENIVVSFAGDIDEKTARQLVEDAFGDVKPAASPAALPVPVFTGGDTREERDYEQLNLYVAFPAPARGDADAFAAMMLEELLAGGMSSPLFQEIREKRGLVYTVGADYADLEKAGLFVVSAGTGKGNAGELMKVTFDVLGGIAKNGFDDVAREKAADRIIRHMKEMQEKAGAAASDNAAEMLSDKRLIPLEEYEARLKAVSADDIRRVCINMLKDGVYALGAVGPLDTLPSESDIKTLMQASVKGLVAPAAVARNITFTVPAAQTQSAQAGDPKITILKNGMTVVTLERAGNLSCGAWVGAGSDHETPALNGATHMNEHMMFKGTPSYPAGAIDRIVETELGGSLNAYTTRDKTCYYFFSLLPDALEKVVDICGEMVFKATLDNGEFDGKTTLAQDGKAVKNKGERDVVIEELRRSNDNVEDRAVNLLMETAYPNQPHGWTILGPENTLRALTVEQLAAYRDEFYVANNVVFCAVGPVRHEDFVEIVERKYGAMPHTPFAPLPAPVYQGGTVATEADGARLCTVMLAAPGAAKADADTYAYAALGAILGDGMSSRLYRALVDGAQLTADVETFNMDFKNAGTFMVIAATEAEKVKPLIEGIYAVLRDTADTLTQSELDKAKAMMEMGLISGMEANRDACDGIAVDVYDHGRVLTLKEISDAIAKLTVEDVKRAARKILSANPTAAVVAPKGTDAALLPIHAEVVAARDVKKPQAEAKPQKPPKAPKP